MKKRCYEDIRGTYQCANVPVWRCLELECDLLKGIKPIKMSENEQTLQNS